MRTLNNNELNAVTGGIGIGGSGRADGGWGNDGSPGIVIGGGLPTAPVLGGGRIDLGFGGYFFPIFEPAPPLPLPKPEPGKP